MIAARLLEISNFEKEEKYLNILRAGIYTGKEECLSIVIEPDECFPDVLYRLLASVVSDFFISQ